MCVCMYVCVCVCVCVSVCVRVWFRVLFCVKCRWEGQVKSLTTCEGSRVLLRFNLCILLI